MTNSMARYEGWEVRKGIGYVEAVNGGEHATIDSAGNFWCSSGSFRGLDNCLPLMPVGVLVALVERAREAGLIK